MRRNLGLLATSMFLILILLELGARRFADPTGGHAEVLAQAAQARSMSVHMKSDDPELVYATRPDYSANGFRVSEAHGILRATDVPLAKPEGTFRIAVLGDSIAAAHPIRAGGALAFADQLEQRLNARPGARSVQVLNFGTDGYGSLQEARLLETQAARFAPDLVVVAYCMNDPGNSYTPTVWFLDGKAPGSYLLDLVRRRLGATPSELSPAHPRYTYGTIDWERLYQPGGQEWLGVERALARVAGYAEAQHVPAVLVLFPLLLTGQEPPADQEQAQRLYVQVGEAAVRHGLRFIDLRPAFRGYPAEQIRLIPDDPIHPNALGHRLAAEAILSELEAEALVP